MTTKYCAGSRGNQLRYDLHYLRKTENIKPGFLKGGPLTNYSNGPSRCFVMSGIAAFAEVLRRADLPCRIEADGVDRWGIQVFLPYVSKTWMARTSPAMTSG
jgi:hypothetical protein